MATKTEKEPPVTVKQAEGHDPVGTELIAQSIVRIDEAMKAALASGLKREALVILLHAECNRSGIGKPQIRAVLESMERLRKIYTTL